MMRAVGRDPRAGPDQHAVAGGQGADRHQLDRAVGRDALGFVGQQRSQRGEGALRLPDRLHLLPVPEQHDRHEQRQLPPELEVEPPEAGRHRRHPGDGDRHRDQQHHPWLPVAHLGDGTGQERLAAPGEDERAEHRPDPGDAVDLVAEPLHHHLARDDDGDGQQQREPEPPPERLRVMAGVLVVGAVTLPVVVVSIVMVVVVVVVVVVVRGRPIEIQGHVIYPRGVWVCCQPTAAAGYGPGGDSV